MARTLSFTGSEGLLEELHLALTRGAAGQYDCRALWFSLIGRKGEELSVHRLVQAVVRDRLEDAERQAWAAAAVALLNPRFPFDSDDVLTWPVCARLLTHALQTGHWAEAFAAAPEATERLLNLAALYLRGRAEFTGARALHERALRMDEAGTAQATRMWRGMPTISAGYCGMSATSPGAGAV